MKVAIIGVGTTAMIVADIILESHNFKLAGFVGISEEEKVLGSTKEIYPVSSARLTMYIFANRSRIDSLSAQYEGTAKRESDPPPLFMPGLEFSFHGS